MTPYGSHTLPVFDPLWPSKIAHTLPHTWYKRPLWPPMAPIHFPHDPPRLPIYISGSKRGRSQWLHLGELVALWLRLPHPWWIYRGYDGQQRPPWRGESELGSAPASSEVVATLLRSIRRMRPSSSRLPTTRARALRLLHCCTALLLGVTRFLLNKGFFLLKICLYY